MQRLEIRRTIDASESALWRVLDDSSSWPRWTSIDSFELVSPAGDDGLGEIRLFHSGRRTMREQIVERTPNRRLVYTLLAGLAVRDYRADITLSPAVEGTEVRWVTTFRTRVPGMGRMYTRALTSATQSFVDGLAAYAGDSS